MWERLDSRLSPYRTPGANRFSIEIFSNRFPYRYIFTLTLIGVGDIFYLQTFFHKPTICPKNEKIKNFLADR